MIRYDYAGIDANNSTNQNSSKVIVCNVVMLLSNSPIYTIRVLHCINPCTNQSYMKILHFFTSQRGFSSDFRLYGYLFSLCFSTLLKCLFHKWNSWKFETFVCVFWICVAITPFDVRLENTNNRTQFYLYFHSVSFIKSPTFSNIFSLYYALEAVQCTFIIE